MTQHVIIGGGPVATNAIETIREFDGGSSRITLISDEPAHSRMAIPYWLAGNIPREHTYTADDGYFRKLGVDARIGIRAIRIDVAGRQLQLSDGAGLPFDDLLIATGSSPIRLPIPGSDLPGVQPLWSLEHAQRVLETTQGLQRPRVALVGGGFIGFIVLNAMFKRGWDLTVVEREAHLLPRMLDADAAMVVEKWLNGRGVKTFCSSTVTEIREAGAQRQLHLQGGKTLDVDLVILAIGIRPNIDLAQAAGIETDDGILVTDRMQTSVPFIFAGGDVAQGPALFSDRREIHAIQPTAVDHGRVAGANMAGQDVRYAGSLLMNVVDVCGLQCSSFGNWSNAGATAMVISNPPDFIYRKLLWSDDRITGAIFTGRPNDMGMLNDIGMVKGLMQTNTPLGPWKEYLAQNPFDIRRAYVASGVAQKLTKTTLLGRPFRGRAFQFGDAQPAAPVGKAHADYVTPRLSS